MIVKNVMLVAIVESKLLLIKEYYCLTDDSATSLEPLNAKRCRYDIIYM